MELLPAVWIVKVNVRGAIFTQHASFTGAAGLNKSPAVDFSAAISASSMAFGGEVAYVTASGEFTE
ncbi:hypothetical protein Peur_010758 [Populus x canadensis]